jgi:hypothetical protein
MQCRTEHSDALPNGTVHDSMCSINLLHFPHSLTGQLSAKHRLEWTIRLSNFIERLCRNSDPVAICRVVKESQSKFIFRCARLLVAIKQAKQA